MMTVDEAIAYAAGLKPDVGGTIDVRLAPPLAPDGDLIATYYVRDGLDRTFCASTLLIPPHTRGRIGMTLTGLATAALQRAARAQHPRE